MKPNNLPSGCLSESTIKIFVFVKNNTILLSNCLKLLIVLKINKKKFQLKVTSNETLKKFVKLNRCLQRIFN